MRILQVLTYYRPHISGLTIYVERLSRALAQAGHQVTVLTTQYDPALSLEEVIDGVHVLRAPVLTRVSKGVIAPKFGAMARKLLREHDIVHLHLPQFDGAGLAFNARQAGKPSVLTYHCDILLPRTPFNRIVQPVINTANDLAARWVDCIVAYTDDYARHSHLLSRYTHKLRVIPPPVEIDVPTPDDLKSFSHKWQINQGPVIGMAARMATEKGVEVLLNALEIVQRSLPNARVMFAGPYQNVIGEEAYGTRMLARIEQLNKTGNHWTNTGSLKGRELAAFFANCDVHILPSLNSTESFGLVQVESMLCGTPSICSALPGVRVSVQTTGMGEVVPIGDATALAAAIVKVCGNRSVYVKSRAEIAAHYSTQRSVVEYQQLYAELTQSVRQFAAPRQQVIKGVVAAPKK